MYMIFMFETYEANEKEEKIYEKNTDTKMGCGNGSGIFSEPAYGLW